MFDYIASITLSRVLFINKINIDSIALRLLLF